ncbi:MAG TPA: collagen-like protein, partial [Phycisphaerae bacterium]|nr:collagen-like protein [Phycisphaerae bacterium]
MSEDTLKNAGSAPTKTDKNQTRQTHVLGVFSSWDTAAAVLGIIATIVGASFLIGSLSSRVDAIDSTIKVYVQNYIQEHRENFKGEKGDRGEKGERGERGDPGEKGNQGLK